MSFFEQAKSKQEAGEFAEATDLYRNSLEEQPDDFRAFNNLGVCLEALGKADEAENAYRQALELRPDLAAIHYNLGHLFQQTDAIDSALTCYESALNIDPSYVAARYNLGVLYLAQDRLTDAEAAFRKLLDTAPPEQIPESFKVHGNLGRALADQGRFEDAEFAYRQAVELHSENARLRSDLGVCLLALNRADEAKEAFEQALALNPHQRHARDGLAAIYYRANEPEKAAAVYEDLLKLTPDDPIAQHMLAASGGVDAPARASDEYVEATFDSFADSFDRVLKRLDYRAPSLLADAVAKVLQPEGNLVVLDAGCGTGLCGAWLRPYASRLVGVDLSEKMLAKARNLELYDELIKAELTEYLGSQSEYFDMIVCADTLVYFGNLDSVLSNASKALRSQGFLNFTVEQLQDDDCDLGYRLNRHGRYSHARNYIEATLKNTALTLKCLVSDTLRFENRKPVVGWVVTTVKG